MTRKSKRELATELDDLEADEELDSRDAAEGRSRGSSVSGNETFAERHYTEPVASFVYQTHREVARLGHDPEIANSDEPIRGLLPVVREHYGIDDDRDDAVVEMLRSGAVLAEDAELRPTLTFGAVMTVGPQLLEGADEEWFADAFEDDRDDEAAQLIVQAVYEWLADQSDRRREVPA